jgi:sterol 3beta-glucosyltransferase
MKISILTYGSRGDLQPFLALAVGLQKAGHTVQIIGPARFAEFSAIHSVPYVSLPGDVAEISTLINRAGENVFMMIKKMRDYVFDIAPEVARISFSALEGSEFVIHSFLFTTGGHGWAREHGIPDLSIQTFPVFAPTRAFPSPAFSQIPPGVLSYLSHQLTSASFWYGSQPGYASTVRAHPEIPYPKKLYWPFRDTPDRLRTPLLFAMSPSVIPPPTDWGGRIYVPGYFFLDEEDYQPPEALSRFLAEGAPPICVSFGSMVHDQAEKTGKTLLQVFSVKKERAIILTGWGGWKPDTVPENILYLQSAPHDWLFPRCKTVIHHGGAGTTAAALRAGVPAIIVPHAADQPFWARRVYALGVGAKPFGVRQLTVERLLAALAQAEHPPVLQRASALGAQIRAEDGVGRAIRLIEQHFPT